MYAVYRQRVFTYDIQVTTWHYIVRQHVLRHQLDIYDVVFEHYPIYSRIFFHSISCHLCKRKALSCSCCRLSAADMLPVLINMVCKFSITSLSEMTCSDNSSAIDDLLPQQVQQAWKVLQDVIRDFYDDIYEKVKNLIISSVLYTVYQYKRLSSFDQPDIFNQFTAKEVY